MAYKNPESKREGCYYPNCSGYLEVPFCCHDPKALPALKAARLAQIETPKRPWVGLTDEQLSETYNELYTQYTRDDVNIADFILIARTIESQLKELNT